MRDIDFLGDLLRVKLPWEVTESKLDVKRGCVDVRIEWRGPGQCPVCQCEAPKHDHRERVWRDLDLCADQLFIHAVVPRVDCPEHGIHTVHVPWAQGRSEFTDRFERVAILFLSEMSITAVSRRLGISWDCIDGIMSRAVKRGMERRAAIHLRLIGIDEKSIKKRHKYFTIVSDLEKGTVVWVGRGRKRETIDAFWQGLSSDQRAAIEGIAMDMWLPYFESTMAYVPDAASKIVFDKFHLTAYLTKAVDLTRRKTVRAFGSGENALKGTRYDWLRNPASMSAKERRAFTELRQQYTGVGRAWAIKESFAHFWEYRRNSIARKYFSWWYFWATHSRISAIVEVAKMFKRHFENIITYLKLRITNATAEGLNSKIQWIKYQARGFRNEDRFERAILFHCAGLDLLPTHYNS